MGILGDIIKSGENLVGDIGGGISDMFNGFMGGVDDVLGGVDDVLGVVDDVLGGGDEEYSSKTSTNTTVNATTNVTTKVDLEPLADVLKNSNSQNLQSQKDMQQLQILHDENVLNATLKQQKNAQELEAIKLSQEAQKISKIDSYFNQSKQIIVFCLVGYGLIYLYKKGK